MKRVELVRSGNRPTVKNQMTGERNYGAYTQWNTTQLLSEIMPCAATWMDWRVSC